MKGSSVNGTAAMSPEAPFTTNVWAPAVATGTRTPLKVMWPPRLLVVARGGVAMLSRYSVTCSPGVKPFAARP